VIYHHFSLEAGNTQKHVKILFRFLETKLRCVTSKYIMENTEIEPTSPRRIHFDWLLPIFYKPKSTLASIVTQETSVFWVPLLVLTVLALLSALASSPARQTFLVNSLTPPPDFQSYPADMQEAFFKARESAGGPLFSMVLPAMGSIFSIWLGWLVLGSILHLSLTLTGSRGSNRAALNLAAWAALPLAVRYIIQGIAPLVTGQLISKPGLSGFAPADGAFWSAFLSNLDIYFIWQVILLYFGARALSGLSRTKTWGAVLLSVVIFWLLLSLPGFLGGQISNISGKSLF
jgi:hypothetical protein